MICWTNIEQTEKKLQRIVFKKLSKSYRFFFIKIKFCCFNFCSVSNLNAISKPNTYSLLNNLVQGKYIDLVNSLSFSPSKSS